MSRFDAYNCTIDAPPLSILRRFADGLPSGQVGSVVEGKGRKGYATSRTLNDWTGKRIAAVLSGGVNEDPHVEIQGPYTPDLVPMIRETFPEHRVTRVDSAIDFSGPGVFERMAADAQAFARYRKPVPLKWSTAGPWPVDGEARWNFHEGLTFYVGSRQSLVCVRGYEKGLKHAAECRHVDELPDLTWVRLEAECKPQTKEQKVRYSTIEPDQVWGASQWSCDFRARMTGVGVEKVMEWKAKEPELFRSGRSMVYQYGNVLHDLRAELGGETEFFKWVEKVREEHQELKREIARRRSARAA